MPGPGGSYGNAGIDFSGGQGMGMSPFGDMLGQGIGSVFGNLLNDPRDPYRRAQHAYEPFMEQARQAYNPFFQGGMEGMQNYQNFLGNMKDPSGFLNNLMGQYQASPYSQYLQNQAQLAGQNQASANGTLGSTPFLQQSQQNAANISSQDMQNWLAKVLGINTEYGQGQQNLMNQGFNAASGLGSLANKQAENEAQFDYAKSREGQQRSGGLFGGLGNIAGGLIGMLL